GRRGSRRYGRRRRRLGGWRAGVTAPERKDEREGGNEAAPHAPASYWNSLNGSAPGSALRDREARPIRAEAGWSGDLPGAVVAAGHHGDGLGARSGDADALAVFDGRALGKRHAPEVVERQLAPARSAR